jgi:hypothetical protein
LCLYSVFFRCAPVAGNFAAARHVPMRKPLTIDNHYKSSYSTSFVSQRKYSTITRSAAGVHDYDYELQNFKLKKFKYFNFAQDVIDKWAVEEKVEVNVTVV